MLLKLLISWLDIVIAVFVLVFIAGILLDEKHSIKGAVCDFFTPFFVGAIFLFSAFIVYAEHIYDTMTPKIVGDLFFMFVGCVLVSLSWPTTFGLCPYRKKTEFKLLLDMVHKRRTGARFMFAFGLLLVTAQVFIDRWRGLL